MWVIIEFIVIVAILLISVTEFFYPLLSGKPLFGSFRKKIIDSTSENTSTLDQKISAAKEKAEEIKKVQDEVKENLKSARQLKNESDNLLK